MSAGDAGPAGDAGQAQQGEGGGEAQQGAPDIAAFLEQQSQQNSQNFEQLRDMFQHYLPQQQQQEQAPAEEPVEGPDLGFLETGDPYADQQLAQGLQNLVQSQAQQQVQQVVGPLQQDLAELRREREAEHLLGEFPELSDPEVAQRLIGMSRTAAETIGHPELADVPGFWRLVHAAESSFRAAAEERERGDSPAHLEGGGGPGAGQQSQVDLGDLIVNGQSEGAPLGRRSLPFG
jgi:hypothetical protein